MLTAAAVAATAANRWLLAGIAAAIAVLGLAAYARDRSKENTSPRGTRRRAGAMIALGPVIGLVLAPEFGDLTILVALGALAARRRRGRDRALRPHRPPGRGGGRGRRAGCGAGGRAPRPDRDRGVRRGRRVPVRLRGDEVDRRPRQRRRAGRRLGAGRRQHPVRDRRLRASGRPGLRARGLRRRVLRVPGVQRAPGVPLRRPRRSARHRVHPRGRRAGGRSRPGVLARADHAAHPPRHLRPRRPHGRGIPTAAAAVIAPAPQRPRPPSVRRPRLVDRSKRSSSWWWPRSSCP